MHRDDESRVRVPIGHVEGNVVSHLWLVIIGKSLANVRHRWFGNPCTVEPCSTITHKLREDRLHFLINGFVGIIHFAITHSAQWLGGCVFWNARARNRKSMMLPSWGCIQWSWMVFTSPMLRRSMLVASSNS